MLGGPLLSDSAAATRHLPPTMYLVATPLVTTALVATLCVVDVSGPALPPAPTFAPVPF